MASRNIRVPRFSVYQLGRGNEPVIVVGSTMSLVPRYIFSASQTFSRASAPLSDPRRLLSSKKPLRQQGRQSRAQNAEKARWALAPASRHVYQRKATQCADPGPLRPPAPIKTRWLERDRA